MVPGKYNIVIYRGGTWGVSVEAENAVAVGYDFSTNYDLIRMQIRPPWIKGIPVKPPLLELTVENGRITITNAGMLLVLSISAADTAVMTFNEGVYELELVKSVDLTATPPVPVEIVDKILFGSVSVVGEITV